ncbi:oxidoreductase, FAD-binding protein [Phaeosphaeriaceae sp. PMI808]|nr:oxidoreductase, FAD-binding protein [Phaeosphaeriaceae sp. PMI808]
MAPSIYNTTPHYTANVLLQGTEEYERCRRNNPSAHTPDRYPQEIHAVKTPEDVSAAVKRAAELGVSVGIRSSGHAFALSALVHNGILIDTSNLNRHAEYNPETQEISFGPAVRVEEVERKLSEVKRFFPHGHAPTVGAGGFLLAGGQGWFVRGWGATCQTWITKLEVVVPDGRVLIASRFENKDIFWAARGSGLGFFGVVTKFWGRTIPASTLWERTFTFELRDKYEALMTWALEKGEDTPKYGTDLNFTIFYPEKYAPGLTTDEIPKGAKMHLGVALQCYCDTVREARTLLGAYDDIPDEVRDCLVEMKPVQMRNFADIFRKKREFIGSGGGENWQILSLLNEPSIPLPRLLEAIKPAITGLQTRTSSAFLCICDIVPDEDEASLSIPQKYYISTVTGWYDTKRGPAIRQTMLDHYKRALPVACGTYVADYDPTCEDANGKPMSDTALAKFLQIRAKWDPKDMFPNYKQFLITKDKINRITNKSSL